MGVATGNRTGHDPAERIAITNLQVVQVMETDATGHSNGPLCVSQLAGSLNLTATIHCADALHCLRGMDSASVDSIVTSPPYYQQRNYKDPRQVGLEATPELYLNRLAAVFRECLRVTKPTGSMWIVIGDKYIDGELLGMPWRLALLLKQQGWLLRNDVIWHKPNAMPSSSKNRLTVDHEFVFFFARSKKYFYDSDAIREPHVTFTEQSRMRGGRRHFFQRDSTPEAGKNQGNCNLHDARWDQAFHPKGRNKRTVWSIPLSKFRDAHFAVFPESLVETCLKASCPPRGIVLDPFLGSGTTGVVAHRLGLNFVGIDCVNDYCEMARSRIISCRSDS